MSETKWNLVDNLSEEGSEDPYNSEGLRREFYLPIASPSPNMELSSLQQSLNRIETLPVGTFTPSDINSLPNNHPIFQIIISPPDSGFMNDGDLPDPAFRVHAVSSGFVYFKPDDGTYKDSLILQMRYQLTRNLEPISTIVPWWNQWIKANCIPIKIIYENIDRSYLRNLLSNLSIITQFPPTEDQLRLQRGISFPSEVTEENRDLFIERFLAGGAGTFFDASPGAFMGCCAGYNETIDSNNTNSQRMLRLHVQYQDHTETDVHYMNPRELLHLFFGIDSFEVTGGQQLPPSTPMEVYHPLLQCIQFTGE
ncbi:MAG: hypothetical protein ACXAC7_23370, partial [Candidatus Hodarchaeales archaeon]